MPILLFVFALTALGLAFYGLLYSVHAMLVKGFAMSEAAQAGGLQIAARLLYFQFPIQFAATVFVFKVIFSPRYVVAVFCAVIAFLISVSIFLRISLYSVWGFFIPNPLQWDMAEGFVLLLSVTMAWLATAAIRPQEDRCLVVSE
jgi:hypothetical protein